jgi:hypothetical protein
MAYLALSLASAEAGERDLDEPLDRFLRGGGSRGTERVQAVARQLAGSYVVPNGAGRDGIGDQLLEHLGDQALGVCHLLAGMEECCQVNVAVTA